MKPKDFIGDSEEYLNYVLEYILPVVQEEHLAERVDVFIEKSAFQPEESKRFLQKQKQWDLKSQFMRISLRLEARV